MFFAASSNVSPETTSQFRTPKIVRTLSVLSTEGERNAGWSDVWKRSLYEYAS